MSLRLFFPLILIVVMFAKAHSQERIPAKPEYWTASDSSSVTFNENSIYLQNHARAKSAILWLKDVNFKKSTIELDIKGKDIAQQSFVGVAFHAVNDTTYKCVYFRPFNFRNPERKMRAVQYVDIPGNEWYVLREKFPGKYENAVNPVPDPNDWFHARIVIDFPEVKVYVNDAKEPSLVVNQITDRKEGKLGLWIASADGWFRNVVVKRNK